jgi:branched-chain amino acid transport system substrate-binding protein
MAPITGPVAFIGTEQRDWAKFSVQEYNRRNGTKFKLIEGDTQLDPAQASTVSQQLASNTNVLGVVGPAGSQEVIAVAPNFKKVAMAYVSGSATRTTLTDGSNPGFFRVIPNDGVQGPTTARFIRDRLKAKKVFIIDDQTAYSIPLADSVGANLKANNIAVERESVAQSVTDFSALVSKISSDTDVIYLPWQVAANGALLGQQMKEQGKKGVIVGSDGLFAPGDFAVEGSYVFAFAPDIRGLKADAAIVKAYDKKYGKDWGTFGPPTYLAAQVLMIAIRAACLDGKITRAEVRAQVRTVTINPSILGSRHAFSPKGDPLPAKFYAFQIQGGKYTLVA